MNCSNDLPNIPYTDCQGNQCYHLPNVPESVLKQLTRSGFDAAPALVFLGSTQYAEASEDEFIRNILLQAEAECMVVEPLPELQVKQIPYVECLAKEHAYRMTQPKHASVFTKSNLTTKARKAARRRAKAGRKASR